MSATELVIMNIVLDVAIVFTIVGLLAHSIVADRHRIARLKIRTQRARAYRPQPARGSSRWPVGA